MPEVANRSDAGAEIGGAGKDSGQPPRRRFGLQFFVVDAPAAQPAYGYCEHQQVTVDDEGRPVVHGPRAGWEQTSTGNMDGNEETKMDQDPDTA